MSIEALYAVRFADLAAPKSWRNGGVVVLETERLFGGDSWFFYIGSYSRADVTVTGHIHVERHLDEPDTMNAWGTQEKELDAQFNVSFNSEFTEASGSISHGEMELGVRLIRVAELP